MAFVATFIVCALLKPSHPSVRAAFMKHDRYQLGALKPLALRRVLSDLGVDVSHQNARQLVISHGNGTAVDEYDVENIIQSTAIASPARIWIALDPNGNGIRRNRISWNRFGKAGTLSMTRLAHYTLGLYSLAFGTYDMINYIIHLGVPSMTYDDAAFHAILHLCAAIFSLPRFRYKWDSDKPFHLWMPTARDANMWPSAIVYMWYTSAMLSTFVLPSNEAIFMCDEPIFQVLTWLTTLLVLYGTSRTILETDDNYVSGVYGTRMSNILQVIWTMAFPVIADTGKCLFIAHDPSIHAKYSSIISAYPTYTDTYIGALLSAMYLGNLACALSSAEHYGAITKEQIGDLANALTLLVNIAVLTGICAVDDGKLATSMLQVTWEGIVSTMT